MILCPKENNFIDKFKIPIAFQLAVLGLISSDILLHKFWKMNGHSNKTPDTDAKTEVTHYQDGEPFIVNYIDGETERLIVATFIHDDGKRYGYTPDGEIFLIG